ncbi:MAG: 4-hydroxybenzoate 3-monooxygenase [Alphaproteobacteria bacterium]|nr:4-hydroxybenzoate 3-monooxygenase [Alphaproteobacteria bacterium]
MRTQVGIVGAGPAGLLLGRMLQNLGIDAVVLESRSRDYVLARIRAGVLEQGTVDTLIAQGIGDRLRRQGMVHENMQIRWAGRRNDFTVEDEKGRRLTTYGQAEIVKDLIERREADNLPLLFSAPAQRIENVETRPRIHFTHEGAERTLDCDFVAGCDGFHGVCRKHIPNADDRTFLKTYPYGWLGILAEAAPHAEIRGFAHSTRGFAVASARSPKIGRLYLQVDRNEDIERWSDEAIWDELDRRFEDGSGHRLNRGRILKKDLAPLRAFVCEAMQHGRIFLAGDAAHIVPPSGAKGLNSAVGDVRVLAEGLRRHFAGTGSDLLDHYAEICLRRIWATVHWSCLLTDTLHIAPNQTGFDLQMQYATLNHWAKTELGRQHFCNAMLGLPYEV